MGNPLRLTALTSADRTAFFGANRTFLVAFWNPKSKKLLGDDGEVFYISNSVVRDRLAEYDAGDMDINPRKIVLDFYRKAAESGHELFGTVDLS